MVEQVNQAENPIREADKESIDRLFNLDPQFLTRENIALIVDKLRSGRGTWIAEKKKSSTKKAPALSKESAQNLLAGFNLSF